jgi:hypothetical protein
LVPTGVASNEEVEVLREREKISEEQFRQIEKLYQNGERGGELDKYKMAAYEMVLAKSDLALAVGNREDAVAMLQQARSHAEEALKATQESYAANRVTFDLLQRATRNLADVKIKLIRLQKEVARPIQPSSTFAPSSTDRYSPPPPTEPAAPPRASVNERSLLIPSTDPYNTPRTPLPSPYGAPATGTTKSAITKSGRCRCHSVCNWFCKSRIRARFR